MTVEGLAAWLFVVMLATVPPGGHRSVPAARESAADGMARYAAIARALAQVSLDPAEPPLFDGADGRVHTAALLLAVALHESHWRRDVDLGLGRYGPRAGRRYHCLMQVAVDDGKTAEGWTAADLVADRRRCVRSGLHLLQRGRRLCGQAEPTAALRHYASGYCHRGQKPAQTVWRTYQGWLRQRPLTVPPRPSRSARPAAP